MSLYPYPALDDACEAADMCCQHMDGLPGCDHEQCCQCCWILHGYCMSQQQMSYQGTPQAQAQGGQQLADRAALDHLRSLKGQRQQAQVQGLNINWLQLAQFVLTMLQQILSQQSANRVAQQAQPAQSGQSGKPGAQSPGQPPATSTRKP
jgi:hypothetical protein